MHYPQWVVDEVIALQFGECHEENIITKEKCLANTLGSVSECFLYQKQALFDITSLCHTWTARDKLLYYKHYSRHMGKDFIA
jgi:hypothetical protein